MRRLIATALLPLLFACTPATTASGPPVAARPAPLSELVAEVDIPYESFTLDNGLTVLVHTDRKSPVVGVTVYYRVGSKHEPRGRTGFAHLFEHLMFGGSENVENFDVPLEAAGSTSTNGSTWYDRTNYVETVPTGALDLALFMESDRMGHLLGAVSQEKLDRQRGVVQNEKRQGDNEPYGLVGYMVNDGLLPVGHPYRHSTIGSMADLDAASLTDVRQWFIDNYGPNNVVLVLAGDIDVATARAKVERWFGDIPRGPEIRKVESPPVAPAATVTRVTTDQVPVLQLHRYWTGPALAHPDSVPITIAMDVLGGLASSRLDNALVRGDQLAVLVTASNEQHEELGFVSAQMDVKPGVDPAAAEARFDAVIADFIANGPTPDELTRAVTRRVSSQIGALELVGGFSGKGATLAEGLLYADDPENYKARLRQMAALTPDDVKAAMQRWLTRPGLRLTVVPGERSEDGATMGGWGDEAATPAPAPDAKLPPPPLATGPKRDYPPVEPVGDLTVPTIERATLSNGIPVMLARRTAVPKLALQITFDAGFAADASEGEGAQSLMMGLLSEGTTSRDSIAIAEEQERLGAAISTGTGTDTSSVSLSALTANLAPSLELMADIVRNPAFAPEEVARLKDQRLAEIAQENASPFSLGLRQLRPLLYGDAHPYGSVGALGQAEVVAALTPDTLRALHARWLRPDAARIAVVGDITMAELLPRLEAAFGTWQAPAGPPPAKALGGTTPAGRQRLVVIDRPNSPQSVLLFGRVLPLKGTDPGQEALDLANQVLGDGFLSRLNLNIREDKGWSYGVGSTILGGKGPEAAVVYTQVQSDKTGPAIAAMLADMAQFPATRPVDDTEFQRVTDGNIRGMPNLYQTNSQVLAGLVSNDWLGRPDDYLANLPDIYRGLTRGDIDAAAGRFLTPDDMTIVVVGDRAQIDEQLKALDIPIEYVDADSDVSGAE